MGRFVETRKADHELARFDTADGGADGIVEQGEERAQRDGCEALCDEEPERVEVLAYVAGRLYHTKVQRACRQAKTCSVAGECVLECAGGGVVALATVADYAGARGSRMKKSRVAEGSRLWRLRVPSTLGRNAC